MQSKAKTVRGSASNITLHAGGGIRFGFMRQNNISGRALSVTDVCSYLFDNDSFISYQLRDEDTDINMIVADGDGAQDSYLALSLALKEKWFAALFAAMPPKEWFRLKQGDTVSVAADALVMPQGWLVSRYTQLLATQGRKRDGDYRQRKPAETDEQQAALFDYVLLVSEDGEHAIEVEKHASGTIRAYATVYRPLSDISETTPFHRPYIVEKNALEEVTDGATFESKTEEAFATTLMLVAKNAKESSDVTETPPPSPVRPAQEITMEKITSNDNHLPAAMQPEDQMLACDTQLVCRIIEEAGRNKLSLEDIIRKVIGLPAEIQDKVYVPLALSDAEKSTLAARYGLNLEDKDQLQRKIVEELQQFAGIK